MLLTTQKEILSFIRAEARQSGLTFKQQQNYINGKTAYKVIDRKTGALLASNMTLSMAYENALSGYFIKLAEDYKNFGTRLY